MAYLTAEKKQELFGQYGKSNTDTGSPESQIALFSYHISHLKEVDIERYRAIVKTLNLRK